jgi:hypothetical protein
VRRCLGDSALIKPSWHFFLLTLIFEDDCHQTDHQIQGRHRSEVDWASVTKVFRIISILAFGIWMNEIVF